MTGLQNGPSPLAKLQVKFAVFRSRFILELVTVEKTAGAFWQRGLFHHRLQSRNVLRLQFQFAAVQITGATTRTKFEEFFHELLQLSVFTPDEFRLYVG
ncbi:hypothetical protein EGN72_07135 [Pseudorhodobacter sp. E13]|nr:hypothetical protein EGN72_07135 [Pseudorhodobacter sp. E13]